MNHISENGVAAILNKITDQLPLIEKTDLRILTDILSELQNLCSVKSHSIQFTNLALRASKLVETILLNDVPFESGYKRLNEGILKMNELIKMPDFKYPFPAGMQRGQLLRLQL